jgi:hypothetical protein
VSSINGQSSRAPVTYHGQDCAEKFGEAILTERDAIRRILRAPARILIMSEGYKADFDNSPTCHLCHKYMSRASAVRNHCHLSSRYLGAAHSSCNLKCKLPSRIPILFHNGNKYYQHIIINAFASHANKLNISCIATTDTNYFLIGVIIDSYNLLATSLDTLTRNLSECGLDKFVNLRRNFPDDDKLEMLTHKAAFPYEFVDSFHKFNQTSIPTREQFYSKLTEQDITIEEYARVCQIWSDFDCQTLADYHDLYITCDALLLADVFKTSERCHWRTMN